MRALILAILAVLSVLSLSGMGDLSDDFNRANSSDVGINWTEFSGAEITNNYLNLTGFGALLSYNLSYNNGSKNVSFDVVSITEDVVIYLNQTTQNDRTGIACTIYGSFNITKCGNNESSMVYGINSNSRTVVASDNITFQSNSTAVSIFVNNTLIDSWNLVVGNGYVGIRDSNTPHFSLDNFTISNTSQLATYVLGTATVTCSDIIYISNGWVNTYTLVNKTANTSCIEQLTDTTYIVRKPIQVNSTGTYYLNSTDTSYLKLVGNNTTDSIAYILNYGNLFIENTNITGWNQTINNVASSIPFVQKEIIRPYILASGSSATMNISNSELNYLGHDANTFGAGGVGWYSGTKPFLVNGSRFNNIYRMTIVSANDGTIENNTFIDTVYWSQSLEINEGSNYIIKNNSFTNDEGSIFLLGTNSYNNTVTNNNMTGLSASIKVGSLAHDNLINNNYIHDTSPHAGIDLHLGVYNNIVENNTINRLPANDSYDPGTTPHGIFLHNNGVTGTRNNIVRNNSINGTRGVGIFLYENASGNNLYNNTISNANNGSNSCIFLDNSWNNTFNDTSCTNTTGVTVQYSVDPDWDGELPTHSRDNVFDNVSSQYYLWSATNGSGWIVDNPLSIFNVEILNNNNTNVVVEFTTNSLTNYTVTAYPTKTNFTLSSNANTSIQVYDVTAIPIQNSFIVSNTTSSISINETSQDPGNISIMIGSDVSAKTLNLSNIPGSITSLSLKYAGNSTTIQTITPSAGIANFSSVSSGSYVLQSESNSPNITSYNPATPLSTIDGNTTQFNITVNQTVNVTWYINGSSIQTNTSVTVANYTNTSDTVGSWNVTAIATNANGTDSQTWIWTVSSPASSGYIPPAPTYITNTQGSFWINHTWQAGSGNITDSYNVSVNGTWTNGTTATFKNTSIPDGGWSNITIFAYNSSGSGTLSASAATNNTQLVINQVNFTFSNISMTETQIYQSSQANTIRVDVTDSDGWINNVSVGITRNGIETNYTMYGGNNTWTYNFKSGTPDTYTVSHFYATDNASGTNSTTSSMTFFVVPLLPGGNPSAGSIPSVVGNITNKTTTELSKLIKKSTLPSASPLSKELFSYISLFMGMLLIFKGSTNSSVGQYKKEFVIVIGLFLVGIALYLNGGF